MTDQIHTEDDFEEINLDDEPATPVVKKEVEPVDDLDDLNLDDTLSDTPIVDEVAEEVKVKPVTKNISIEKSTPVKVKVETVVEEDLDIDLDDETSPVVQPKSEPVITKELVQPIEEEITLDDEPVVDAPKPATVIEELVAPVVVPVPEKKTRKKKTEVVGIVDDPLCPKVVQQLDTGLESQSPESQAIFDPIFDISKINESRKYQTRAIHRSPEMLKAFGDVLSTQGQLEPIHLHKEGEEYFIVVGFGRYDALKSIGMKTIKVIIREDLTPSDIVKLSTGTNEHRLQLGEWDKITSVGHFQKNHKDIPVEATGSDQSKCLTGIFGYSRATIYNYIEMYSFFHDKPVFVEYFKNVKVKQLMISLMLSAKQHLDDEDSFVKFLDAHKDETKREFELSLQAYIGERHMNERIINDSNNDSSTLDIDGTSTKTEQEIDKLVDEVGTGTNVVVDMEKVKKTSEFMTALMTNIGTVEDAFKNLLSIPNVTKYVDNSRLEKLKKKITSISKTYLQFSTM